MTYTKGVAELKSSFRGDLFSEVAGVGSLFYKKRALALPIISSRVLPTFSRSNRDSVQYSFDDFHGAMI